MNLPPELDSWHPVYLSRKLGKKPVGIKVCGVELVLFRTSDGVAALLDRCPHRAMRLSTGKVKGNCIECPYHGWQFDKEGAGMSPGTPKMKPSTTHLSCVEENGAIWVRSPHSTAQIQRPDVGNFHLGSVHHFKFKAPLEIVMDNFCESEHTPTVHTFVGFSLEEIHKAEMTVEVGKDYVREVTVGPQKHVPAWLSLLLGVHTGDRWVDQTTAWFAPCHAVLDVHWEDPQTGEHRPEHVRSVTFFTPRDDQHTDVFAFAYLKQPTTGRFGINRLLAFVNQLATEFELGLDVKSLANLADTSTELSGFKLGRFDRVMVEIRRGVKRYRGQTGLPVLQSEAAAPSE